MKRLNLGLLVYFISVGLVFASELGIDFGEVLHDLSTGVLDVLIPVIVALIGIMAKKGFDLIKFKLIRGWVRKWVLSAYQRYTSEQHREKFNEVARKIHKKFGYLTEEEIRDYIEEAVKGVKIELGKKD